MISWHQSTTGSPKDLTPLTCRRRRHCWKHWGNATPVDTPSSPQSEERVDNSLSVKYFHEVSAGNVHTCWLKLRIGEVSRLNRKPVLSSWTRRGVKSSVCTK